MNLVTAALPYANGPLHIGHIAGVYLPADIYTRYLKATNQDVLFICGSDEHGAAITLQAKKDKTTPQKIVDKYHKINKKSFEDLTIEFDHYSRTSSKVHHEFASQFFLDLYNKNIFEEKETEQYFDQEAQMFLADRYITGECPNCHNPDAYGDQCEKCGSSLTPQDLINPKSVLSNQPPVLKKTKHWYLPLNKYQKFLEEWILDFNKHKWKKNVLGQCQSWLNQKLQPRAVTRDLSWGVKVPLEKAKGKVLYVWFDAPLGYISATIEWAKINNKNWKNIWMDQNTKMVHFIGKDNIVFHCIIFPTMLKAHGGFILPENVPANEFMNLENKKISTSKNWAIWIPDFIEKYPNLVDTLRYVLCANMPQNRDSDFTSEDFINKHNNELVAIVGNFINRTVVLCHKYFEGNIPNLNDLDNLDNQVIKQLSNIPKQLSHYINNYKFKEGLNLWLELSRIGNKYLADTEPWKIKDNHKRISTILNICINIVANIGILGKIFIPKTSDKICELINLNNKNWPEENFDGFIKFDYPKINSPIHIFEKINPKTFEI